ncbi:MAG TPA: hypothetical protein DCM23_01500 [Firmicutes bacterium]|jgi:hypothetical protein|nr:hypothetical protein [Bacillota bacterium]HAV19705.1 hypothetical protein [Bacillota bacterium]
MELAIFNGIYSFRNLDYVVARELNILYILLDILFLILIAVLLIRLKKWLPLYFGLAGAIIYFIVDYGIFYLLLGTREVIGANTFWFLLWLSISYGFTNFLWIWLFLDKDKHIIDWSALIIIGWFSIALISQSFGSSFATIQISRGTGSYHGIMAAILLVGYLIVIIHNLTKKQAARIPILRLLFIGIVVQLSWEAILLISGIRPEGFNPLIINSLLETNLGMPYLFFIHRYIKNGSRKPLHH